MPLVNVRAISDSDLAEHIRARLELIQKWDIEIEQTRGLAPDDFANTRIEFRNGKPTGRSLTPKQYAARLTRKRKLMAEDLAVLEREARRREAAQPA